MKPLFRKRKTIHQRADRPLRKQADGGTCTLKRLFDIVFSIVALAVLSPLFLLIALAIKLDSAGPAIFTQTRVGLYGRPFTFYKFRSMVHDAESKKQSVMELNKFPGSVTFKAEHDPRITRVGHFLRRFSLDELPQFWNVLKGDMSLVGPRPHVPSDVAKYTQEDCERLAVVPGLTCLWQINGRSDLPFDEQVRLDVEYIRTRSLWLDLVILIKTPAAILAGKGAC